MKRRDAINGRESGARYAQRQRAPQVDSMIENDGEDTVSSGYPRLRVDTEVRVSPVDRGDPCRWREWDLDDDDRVTFTEPFCWAEGTVTIADRAPGEDPT